ncbi:Kinase interacting (KIP1-like) family protein [Euphorbia peplus]|nr:Kinase interacting (KIP1-like) family protein [Euphorbia peplus]
MLHRAANNAYSWWWASHIRTKQSKWLDENLQDMEEKISSMLKIIENNGDTFTQRVEMYYKKRPELVNHVQESYRSYRALAERYDHLSKDMQSANRTIAAVFPEQVQYSIDDDDEFTLYTSTGGSTTPSLPLDLEKIPNVPKQKFLRKPPPTTINKHRTTPPCKTPEQPPSPAGLTEEEAREEIVKIQKEMLALQTEREFLQSICRRCNEKSSGIEYHITDMQAKVCKLQDKFGVGVLNVMDDDEARSLMASTALKSCQDAFNMLQQKQEQSAEKIEAENQRVKDIINNFTSLRGEFLSSQTGEEVSTDEQETETENIDQDNAAALLREKLTEELQEEDSRSSNTVMQLADRINELVEMVVGLETAVSSQDAQINVLRSETDELHQHVKTLEEEKEILKGNAETASIKMKELEEEVMRLKSLSQNVKDQNVSLQTHLTEARCNIDHLTEKLQNVNPDEEIKNEEQKVTKDDDYVNSNSGSVQNEKDSSTLQEQQNENEKKDLTVESISHDNELKEQDTDDDEEEQERRQEDNEKILSEEYGLVVRNFNEVKQRLSDVEKKNRDGFFELALQIRELKNELAVKDKEIECLKESSFQQTNKDPNHETSSTEFKYLHPGGGSPESLIHTGSTHDSDHDHDHEQDHWTIPNSPQQQIFDHTKSTESLGEFAATLSLNEKEEIDEIIRNTVTTIEEKLRAEIDELLEGNLEFWMRFSNSVNQIDKYRNSVKDLKAELKKLKAVSTEEEANNENKHQWITSEARAIYKHLGQIQTELTVWMENNAVLKDEIESKNASLMSIHEEIIKLSDPESGLHRYQAAKFLGEILNMKQESDKVSDELEAGQRKIIILREQVEKILTKIDEELEAAAASRQGGAGARKSRIPLRSFLFGVKLKKQKSNKPSILSRIQAGFQESSSSSAPK